MSKLMPLRDSASPFAFRLSPFCLVLLFAVVLWLDTRYNQFPYFYHPDEAVKVEQLRTGNWNFHHPMLMLTATKAAVALGDVPPQEQRIVAVGRWVSAGFVALAVVALSLLAFAW